MCMQKNMEMYKKSLGIVVNAIVIIVGQLPDLFSLFRGKWEEF